MGGDCRDRNTSFEEDAPDPRDAEIAALKAEVEKARAALAYAVDRRGTQFDFDEWLPMVVAALGREPAPLPPHTNPRAEKAEAERDAALAANAELRAALDTIRLWRGTDDAQACGEYAAKVLARLDLGAGMVVVERGVVERWRLDLDNVEQYGDTIDERVLKTIADLDALLRKGGG